MRISAAARRDAAAHPNGPLSSVPCLAGSLFLCPCLARPMRGRRNLGRGARNRTWGRACAVRVSGGQKASRRGASRAGYGRPWSWPATGRTARHVCACAKQGNEERCLPPAPGRTVSLMPVAARRARNGLTHPAFLAPFPSVPMPALPCPAMSGERWGGRRNLPRDCPSLLVIMLFFSLASAGTGFLWPGD